jgi:hypothetical protein
MDSNHLSLLLCVYLRKLRIPGETDVQSLTGTLEDLRRMADFIEGADLTRFNGRMPNESQG